MEQDVALGRNANEVFWTGTQEAWPQLRDAAAKLANNDEERAALAANVPLGSRSGVVRVSLHTAGSVGNRAHTELRRIGDLVHQISLEPVWELIPRDRNSLSEVRKAADTCCDRFDLSRCPDALLANVSNAMQPIEQAFASARQGPANSQEEAARLYASQRNIGNQVRPLLQALWPHLAALVSYLAASAAWPDGGSLNGQVKSLVAPSLAELDASAEQAKQAVRSWEGRFEKIENDAKASLSGTSLAAQGLLEEANRVLASVRDASAASGAQQFGSVFTQISEGHAKASSRWLAAGAVAVACSVGWAAYLIFCGAGGADQDDPAGWLETWVPRLVLELLLISVAVFCGRVYAVHRHNAIVARHRSAALSTFHLLVGGAPTPEAKAAIVSAAAGAIYAMHPTSPNSSPEANVIVASELLRATTAAMRGGNSGQG